MRDGRMYISRQQLLKASRRGPWSLLRIVRIVPLERMARHLGVELPHMPRHWHGYRAALVKNLSRRVSAPVDDARGWH
jgi:hypothetical protein